MYLKLSGDRKYLFLVIKSTFTLIFQRFPRIKFFGLQRVHDTNLKSIVRHILWLIKDNNISHPLTICVFCDDAEYDKVEKLHRMIDSKKLLKNYTIHRQYDRFYVQWK